MLRSQSSLRLEAKGIALLTILALLLALSIAFYEKAFTSTVVVTVQTQRAGLQLNNNADVVMRGAFVGRVSKIEQRDGRAVLTLSLDKDDAAHIPGDIVARILPTTLFGQKYVELVVPAGGGGTPIASGAVIPEDRSRTAVEITQAFDDLEPVLTAVHPEDLSATLQAVAQGLQGRGEQLGRTVEATLHLLRDFRDHLPLLTQDMHLLGAVSTMYGASMHDILTVLDNAAFTSRSVTDVRHQLDSFFGDVNTLSVTAKKFLDRNGDGIVELNRTTEPVLRELARYAPELPCLLEGLVVGNKEFGSAFRNGKLNSYAKLGLQYPGYGPGDRPRFGKGAPGPTCAGMPGANGQPYVVMPHFNDGGSYHQGQLVSP